MAGGSLAPAGVAKERAEQYRGSLTPYVVIACLVAAVGGSIFGYDIGISGTFCFLYPASYRIALVFSRRYRISKLSQAVPFVLFPYPCACRVCMYVVKSWMSEGISELTSDCPTKNYKKKIVEE